MRLTLRVPGRPPVTAEVRARRGTYSALFNERRQRDRQRRLGCR